MLPHLVDLESPFDAATARDYDPVELVRYALGVSDHRADLGIRWLEEGVPVSELPEDLRVMQSQQQRPQRLRHRARRLTKRADDETH